MSRQRDRSVRTVAISALLLCGVLPAQAQTRPADGVIHFTGEIVAEPYGIAMPSARAANAMAADKAGDVVFERQNVDRPSASVSVEALGGRTLDMTFMTSQGKREAVSASRFHAIGQDGGTLSIRAHATQVRTAALMTLRYD